RTRGVAAGPVVVAARRRGSGVVDAAALDRSGGAGSCQHGNTASVRAVLPAALAAAALPAGNRGYRAVRCNGCGLRIGGSSGAGAAGSGRLRADIRHPPRAVRPARLTGTLAG